MREVADRSDGGALPRFVEREFREFLTCGVLSRGFARVRCENCAFERLVPFSCKRRGFRPIEAADVLRKILGLPTDPPAALPARPPPSLANLFPDTPV